MQLKILRKRLNPDGTVDHDPNAEGNWNAAEQIRKQAVDDERNIWTAMPDSPYIGNWNNFTVGEVDEIERLFGILGYNIQDYHNETSHCKDTTGVENGIGDDIKGLINFVRGKDYFDYDGDCKITETRDHVLGDIYHSQLVEIGPPNASIDFTAANEEAYFRANNNYQAFQSKHKNREKIIYAGSNSGALHAINADDGTEAWAFIPPFIAGILPSIINPGLDGEVGGSSVKAGGTNAIFGVDGSPVVHDVFIRGYDKEGELEDNKNWHTILFVPYGRGGAGFSVLDVTYPILTAGQGPIHMFSIYNDSINNKVLVADHDGEITEHTYSSGSANISDSLEGKQADSNLNDAKELDGDDCDETDPSTCCLLYTSDAADE